MDTIKIIRIAAMAVAIIAAFVTIPYVALILMILGLAIGFMGVSEERRLIFMVTTVTLAGVTGALGSIPEVGGYLTSILSNMSAVLNAGAVAVILMIVKDRLSE